LAKHNCKLEIIVEISTTKTEPRGNIKNAVYEFIEDIRKLSKDNNSINLRICSIARSDIEFEDPDSYKPIPDLEEILKLGTGCHKRSQGQLFVNAEYHPEVFYDFENENEPVYLQPRSYILKEKSAGLNEEIQAEIKEKYENEMKEKYDKKPD